MVQMAKLKVEVLTQIKHDPDLFAIVCKELGIKPVSLTATIDRNGASLNRYSLVKTIAEYLGKEPEEIMEESNGA